MCEANKTLLCTRHPPVRVRQISGLQRPRPNLSDGLYRYRNAVLSCLAIINKMIA